MKKNLPPTLKSKGFSLIEILVAVSIIAILSVIAIALFTNAQRDTRDSKRKSELDAISKTLEINKTVNGYEPASTSNFSGGKFPGGNESTALDPQGYPYCISSNSTGTAIGDPSVEGWTKDPTAGCPNSFSLINGSNPTSGHTAWKICTLLENRGSPSLSCRTNAQ